MALSIDTSRAPRLPSELSQLAEAIKNAHEHDETIWIEWKSQLDLETTEDLFKIAKAIIGFANRQPDTAQRYCEGFSYIIGGMAPGGPLGVNGIDPEVLISKIRAYVGDVIRWSPEYINADGKKVLIVVVDPPKRGDTIHCLRKTFNNFYPGTIFVRHPGKTVPASPTDLQRLQQRILDQISRIKIGVSPTATIETPPDIDTWVSLWRDQKRKDLLSARYRAPVKKVPRPGSALAAISDAFIKPDTRDEATYAEEIERYLGYAGRLLERRALWKGNQHAPAQLHVSVTNPTDVGLRAVRLRVHIAGDISDYDDDLLSQAQISNESSDIPSPPEPLGTPIYMGPSTAVPFTPIQYQSPHLVSGIFDSGPGYTVRNTGSVDIEYDDFDLRPFETVSLPSIPLVVREPVGTRVTFTWCATGQDIRGQEQGETFLDVAPSTCDLDSLLEADQEMRG